MSRDPRPVITPARRTAVAGDTGRVLPLAALVLTTVAAIIKPAAPTTRAPAAARTRTVVGQSQKIRTADLTICAVTRSRNVNHSPVGDQSGSPMWTRSRTTMTGFSRLPTLMRASDRVEPERASSAKRRPSGDHAPPNSVSVADSFNRSGAPPDKDIIQVRTAPSSEILVKISLFPSGDSAGSSRNLVGLPGKSFCVIRG